MVMVLVSPLTAGAQRVSPVVATSSSSETQRRQWDPNTIALGRAASRSY